ncbi:MAG: thioredoxin family protein [Pseudomonadota bacterium]|nr:thioredoxin family protein [Pseudomonadota bacterium]MDP2352631.1 thioredoxin family protein [Pseudomonadota bacterium]
MLLRSLLNAFTGLGLAFLLTLMSAAQAGAGQPDWQAWSPRVFEQAKREGRLVLLDVKAEWCVACRKMDATGFRDPRVLDTLRQRYVPVRADIDREPEIMKRYGARGVPAVVILDGEGREIIQRRGYLEPDWLYWLLVAVADDPRPEAHR